MISHSIPWAQRPHRSRRCKLLKGTTSEDRLRGIVFPPSHTITLLALSLVLCTNSWVIWWENKYYLTYLLWLKYHKRNLTPVRIDFTFLIPMGLYFCKVYFGFVPSNQGVFKLETGWAEHRGFVIPHGTLIVSYPWKMLGKASSLITKTAYITVYIKWQERG